MRFSFVTGKYCAHGITAVYDLINRELFFFYFYEEHIGSVFAHFGLEIFFSQHKYIRLQVTCRCNLYTTFKVYSTKTVAD